MTEEERVRVITLAWAAIVGLLIVTVVFIFWAEGAPSPQNRRPLPEGDIGDPILTVNIVCAAHEIVMALGYDLDGDPKNGPEVVDIYIPHQDRPHKALVVRYQPGLEGVMTSITVALPGQPLRVMLPPFTGPIQICDLLGPGLEVKR